MLNYSSVHRMNKKENNSRLRLLLCALRTFKIKQARLMRHDLGDRHEFLSAQLACKWSRRNKSAVDDAELHGVLDLRGVVSIPMKHCWNCGRKRAGENRQAQQRAAGAINRARARRGFYANFTLAAHNARCIMQRACNTSPAIYAGQLVVNCTVVIIPIRRYRSRGAMRDSCKSSR